MNAFERRGVKSNESYKEAVVGLATLLWSLQALNVDIKLKHDEPKQSELKII
ncbi:hypothetical protein ACTHOS_01825 [Bacillus safensis]|uniref:hypothetical protein n=1 Tax=Bacillus safensis TaxID=561879 RepID=UPI003F7C7AB4